MKTTKRFISILLCVLMVMPWAALNVSAASKPVISDNSIFANGTPITIEAGTNGTTSIWYMNGSTKTYLVQNADLSGKEIYGGGNGNLSGGSSITMTGGNVTSIYGGNLGSNTTFTGNSSITVTGGAVTYIYGGSLYGTFNGNSYIKVLNVSTEWIYAGSVGHSVLPAVFNGNSTVIVNANVGSGIREVGAYTTFNGTSTCVITNYYLFGTSININKALSVDLDNVIVNENENYVIRGNAEVPAGEVLVINEGFTLTVDSGETLTNNGTILCYGSIKNNGTIAGNPVVYAPSVSNGVHQIKTPDDLYSFATVVNMGNYSANAILVNDIDMSGFADWKSIGETGAYTGTFDGNGKTVSNLNPRSDDTNGARLPLFNTIGSGATVKNINIVSADVFPSAYGAGALARVNSGTVSGILVKNSSVQLGAAQEMGGIVGINHGTITNCGIVNSSLTRRWSGSNENYKMGGICETNNGTVSNCIAYNNTYTNGSTSPLVADGNTPVNSYYYTTSTLDVTSGTAKEQSAFTSGEVANALGSAWGQNIDNGGTNDGYPVLGGARVYYHNNCIGTKLYTNRSSAGAHNYADGICIYCGYHSAHNYEYAASGNKITATCVADGGCDAAVSAVEIVAPVNSVFNGNSFAVSLVFTGSSVINASLSDVVYTGTYSNGAPYLTANTAPYQAGEYTASLTYGGVTATADFSIEPAEFPASGTWLSMENVLYTGQQLLPIVTVFSNDFGKLSEDVEYEVIYDGNFTDVGSYNMTVKGIGNFSGEAKFTFTITEPFFVADIPETDYQIYGSPEAFYLTVDNFVPEEDITYQWYKDGEPVGTDRSFIPEFDAGIYEIYCDVTYKGYTASTNKMTFTVNPYLMEADKYSISIDDTNIVYNGSAQEPDAVISHNGVELVCGVDYEVSYRNNINAGTAYADVTFKGNYEGTATVSFNIKKASLTITANAQSKTYGESDPELTYNVSGLAGEDTLSGALTRAEGEDAGTYEVSQGTLAANDNYDVTFYGANLVINKAQLVITADAISKLVGESDPELTYAVSGLAGDDTLSGEITRAEGETAGRYAITQGTLAASDNYQVIFTDAVFTIVPDDSVIRNLTEDNVTSDNLSDIEKLKDSIANADEETKAEWQATADECEALIDKITEVSEEQNRIADTADDYDVSSVTPEDKSDIQRLIEDIDALLEDNNLTEEERERFDTLKTDCEEMLAVIYEIENRPVSKGLRGDINESGAIDMMDYILLKRAYFGTFELNDVQNRLADVNNSGGIDMMDYILLKRVYFGTFEIAEDIKYVY